MKVMSGNLDFKFAIIAYSIDICFSNIFLKILIWDPSLSQ